jgi:hypothetical protein
MQGAYGDSSKTRWMAGDTRAGKVADTDGALKLARDWHRRFGEDCLIDAVIGQRCMAVV